MSMVHQSSISLTYLERMLLDEAIEPRHIPLSLLEEITDGFSDDQEIGRGGSAVVYKGMLQNGTVAVKRLSNTYMYEKEFHREVDCLMKVKHKNIVRFLGYCADTQGNLQSVSGNFVMADVEQRLLCFEYVPKGSLRDYIQDASGGLEWTARYQIIKGICEGLHYLHQINIVHLDLKPSNILIDDNLTPKIADFGLSRCFDEDQTRAVTTKVLGTMGYLAPEFTSHEITYKFDLYSLGVIIMEIMTGKRGYEDIENILESWEKRMPLWQGNSNREQLQVCAEIGIECIDSNPTKRPVSMQHVLDRLAQTEMGYGSKPDHVTLQHLKDITKNFSNERILGRGGFGVVYKGVLPTGEVVAVKKLLQARRISQKQYENEINLMKLHHPNIVRLVGYCYETQRLLTPREGKFVIAWNTESLLCLECLPNGSLHNYISDASSGFDWRTRWKIIEGICFGLTYLHEQSNGPIIHMDLKPTNILLDENMVPKIADFGLSRLLYKKHIISTATTTGTLGYMPPEYLQGIITPKSDIFSLGVIIMEVITGHREYPSDITTSSVGFIELELQKWRNVLQREPDYTSLEMCCQQIKRCIQIGLICVNLERTKRPTMKQIIYMLQGLESINLYITNEVHVTKIGPWGGNGGTEFDVPESVPQRLESVTIGSGVAIDSFAFSYLDPAGKKQTLGPWGGVGDLTDTIILAPLEIVKEVSGTIGTFDGDTVVTSLTFVTNARTYGPFGKTNVGSPFSVPLMGTNVVGFFGRAGRLVNALGVYVRPSIEN